MQVLCDALSLLMIMMGVVWGKLEDYEFQDVDPPTQSQPKFNLAEAFLKNLENKGFGGGRGGAAFDDLKLRVNKHLYKSETLVTNRITIYPSDPQLAICRCWESKKFPFCDGAHRAHNERNKDNIGPALIKCMPPEMNAYINQTKKESPETKETQESNQNNDAKLNR